MKRNPQRKTKSCLSNGIDRPLQIGAAIDGAGPLKKLGTIGGKMKKPETRIVHKILAALEKEWPKSYFRKIHGSPFQHAGIPDIIGGVEGYH